MRLSFLIAALVLFAGNASAQGPATAADAKSQAPKPTDTSGKVLVLFNAPAISTSSTSTTKGGHPWDPTEWQTMGGWGPDTVKTPTGVGKYIDPTILQKSFNELIQTMGGVFSVSTTTLPGGFAIDEVQLHLSITAEGSIGILGNGGSLGAESSLTVTLRRPAVKP